MNNSVSVSSSKPLTKTNSEVTFTYNPNYLDPFALVDHYGFVVDNNPFASMLLTTTNFVEKAFNANER